MIAATRAGTRDPGVRTTAGIMAICLLSAILLALRWQVLPPSSFGRDLGDPTLQASHFYGIERSSDGRAFRWSRTISAISLPALGSSQVVSVMLNPARPASAPPPHFRLLTGNEPVAEFVAQPGWQTYSATVGSKLYPDIRLEIESDTFYPGPGDKRRLGLAIARLEIAPLRSGSGIIVPPPLWLLLAALAPLWAGLWGLVRSRKAALLASLATALIPTIWSLIIPLDVALPLAGWATALAALSLVLWGGYLALQTGGKIHQVLSTLASSRWEVPLVGLGSALLAIAMTWPLVARLSDSLPGWPADNFAFLYKLWWFRTAIVTNHQWPLFDPNSYAPFGFNLGQGEPTLLNTLPGVVIGSIFNDVVSYNVLALTSFVVAGIGGYLLVREVSGSRLAGLLGCVTFAYCPYRMSQYAGHLQLLGTGWIALSFFFAERTLKTRQPRYGISLGLCLALTALGAWYYAYMVGLAVALYFLVRLVMLRHQLPILSALKPAVGAAIVLLVIAVPVALPSLELWAEGGLSHSAKAADEASASPLDYAMPNELQPVWGAPAMSAHADENVIESNLYLGLVPLALATLGWIISRRAKDRAVGGVWRLWWGVMLVALVLSLGLTLHGLGGQVLVQTGSGLSSIPMPGRLLYDWLPLFSSMRAYARFGVLAILALAVLVGVAWSVIVGRPTSWASRHRAWLTLTVAILILVDFWTSPYSWGTTRVAPTKAAESIAAAPAGLVMQMPLASSQSGPALFWSTYYGKPIAYGYDTFEPPEWAKYKPVLASFPDRSALELLRSWGVRYIVVSANAYGPDWPSTLDYLKSISGLSYVAVFQEERSWDVDPGVLDARPDMEQYADPDTLAVFELPGK